jgi:drug/metabolite transporter (DMT)-like permease
MRHPYWDVLACLGASASYGLSYVYMGRYLTNRGLPPLVLSTGQLIGASGLLLLAARSEASPLQPGGPTPSLRC